MALKMATVDDAHHRARAPRQNLGIALFYLGDLEGSEAEFRHQAGETAHGVRDSITARSATAMVLSHRGALDEASREATRAVTEARAARDHLAEVPVRYALAYVLKRRGAYAEAEQELRGAVALARTMPVVLSEMLAALAGVRLARGDAADALTIAREVLDLGARSSAVARLQALTVEAEARIATGDRAAARARIAEARAEILAIAARIEDEGLRASFLTRGPLSAPLLQLAEAEGAGPAAG